ncbi:hypothetical protein CF15_01740 [Pyrodictium occultum]|uniref:Molybdopterin-guanine dinucleotide biosynthesis protein B (MobB) domain-containing protein n=1 Tax=Pyrodictium occultum TaxID=2309 RepID=A0A0V8RUB3_PYROC|nr:molybdopterin-guanine dinucleotide biosynthesis protein MobB [Pyrodictium occultum]KSW11581.1 hypothetical protein CF15_01740 [Pyrodictium occultum]
MQLVLLAGSGSGVGKTLLGTMLVEELRRRGLRVGVVKHVHHGVDYRVKDTGRYLEAGASRVVAAGPGEYMLVEPAALGFWDAVRLLGEVDVAVVEGFRLHIGEAVSKGGCVVYIDASRAEPLARGRLVEACPGCLGAALEAVLGLLGEGGCSVGEV